MQMTGNTILMTGGGSGIGRALAEQFHALGNRVIISGRRKSALDAVTSANQGMESVVVDLADAEALTRLARQVEERYPALNVPNGFLANGSPSSVTLMARPFGEAELLALGKAYQDAAGFHLRRPDLGA